MESIYALVILTMLACLAVAGFAIWNWGPGIHQRSVRCPEKNRRAKILAEQVEGDFCCLRVVDVKACTLVPGEILTCDRECMSRL
jgi:hypothetical protein